LPIRLRIAVAILGLATVALVAMAVGVYVTFSVELRRNVDDAIRTRAASESTLVDTTAQPIGLRVTPDPRAERANGEALLRLYDAQGYLQADASPAVGSAPAEASLARRALSADTMLFGTIDYSMGERYRVLATPVAGAGQPAGVLLVGVEYAQVADPLRILRLALLIGVLATSSALAGGALFIARRSLRSVAAITSSARRIAGGDLHERIVGVESRDEVGELAATFNNMIERLSTTMERERRFTADAAHELRTPLTALATSIEVTLGQERTPQEYRAALESAERQAERLTALTRQLLILSRLDAAGLRAGFERIDLDALLQAVVDSFQENNPGVTVELQGIEPAVMDGNFELLARAFSNVLENAVNHGSPTIHIDISMRRHDDHAEVTIHDNGPGIAPELADDAFRRFRRGDEARTRGGSGLGLAIVDATVRAHGGEVRLAPSEQGTTIVFTLPVRARGSGPDEATSTARAAG
jgi:signal transduction histidine kinase